jgi:hypothetical protein
MEKSSFKIENPWKFVKLRNIFLGKKLKEYREKAIRRTFLFLSLIFFLLYFFIGVWFYEEICSILIPKVYFLFAIVWVILWFYLTLDNIKIKILRIIFYLFFILVGIFALLPLFIKKDFLLSLFN